MNSKWKKYSDTAENAEQDMKQDLLSGCPEMVELFGMYVAMRIAG